MKGIRSRIAALGVFAALMTMVLGGTALGQSASPTQDEEITFVAGTLNDVRTVNFFRAFETPEFEVMDLNYDLLIGFAEEDLSPVPQLATEWTQSDDGMTWTITVRDDVTWHDGEQFTVDDVLWTYNFIVENNMSGINYFPYTDEFVKVDDYTFEWKTTQPTTAPLAPPYVYILPEHIWGDFSKDDARKFPNYPNTIGTGPFQLTEWQKGQSWTMEANEDYWGGAPQIDKYVVRKYDNEEAMVTALREGEIDYIGDLGTDLFESLEGVEGITTHVGPLDSFTQMSFPMCEPEAPNADVDCKDTGNKGHPALRDHDVRLAIAHAIDKQTLVDRVLQGYGEPGDTFIPPYLSRWHVEPDNPIAFDPAEANRILDEGGYEDTDGDGIREMPGGGEPLDFRFLLRTEDPASITSGEFISGWLRDIGIATRPQAVTDDRLTAIYPTNDFDLYIWGWGVEPDPGFQLSTYTSEECGYWSDTCWSNERYDELYQQQSVAPSFDERHGIIAEMQNIYYDEIPQINLYFYNTLSAYDSAEWGGLTEVPQVGGGYLWGGYGRYSALTLAPASMLGDTGGGTTGGGGDSGISAGIWIAIVGAIVALVVIVALVRRTRSDEHEA
ncbi:MAG TPA: ABC transporter substrate-binding protein [Actinomycetota bacterium]|nr:ABC transporter substrate-binding protein [Actinomycetota bacterium]